MMTTCLLLTVELRADVIGMSQRAAFDKAKCFVSFLEAEEKSEVLFLASYVL